MKKTSIAYVPLDDRPCNLKFPQKLAGLAGVELVTPPKESLGHFITPGNCEKIISWLTEVASKVDLAIISVDMVAFGGLLSSRRFNVSLEVAMHRLEVFKDLKKQNPKITVCPYSLIMRLSPSADMGVEEKLWKAILRYSELIDRVEVFGLLDDKVQLKKVEKVIPKEALKNYLVVRERNHAVGIKMIELASEGIVDFLTIGQDDASAHGLHKKEKRNLEGLVAELAIEEKVKIIGGADEIGMMLSSKCIAGEKIKPKIFVVASNEEWMGQVPLYEDKALIDSVEDHVLSLGGLITGKRSEADIILFINTPLKKHIDLFLEGSRMTNRNFDSFVKDIKKELNSGRVVAIADTSYVNGADPEFMKALLTSVPIENLAAFSAWNTASNSIGATLAHLFLFLFMKNMREEKWKKIHRAYLAERFIDDYLYQTLLRPRIKKDLIERAVSIYDLGEHYPTVEWVVKKELGDMASSFLARHFKDLKNVRFNIALPWPRIFEADVDVVEEKGRFK